MIKLNARILGVLRLIYYYKHYRIALANLYPDQKINWYEDTRKFYFGLDLPEGLNKKEWMETNEKELYKFVWKS